MSARANTRVHRRREKGWRLDSPSADIWGIDRRYVSEEYINNITGDRHHEAPPEFRGGILADDMGLGKTLSMISLIVSDAREHEHPRTLRATLVVVPSSLLQQWEDQLMMHVQTNGPNRIRWAKYHGASRPADMKLLHKYDIVLTSFQTLASEYRKSSTSISLLFSAIWHRVVLDEAHAIRNRNTTTAKAVLELEAKSRWAMTGTPLQNRISDLSSILQFLRVYPYCNRKVFEADIVRVWKLEDGNLALTRLKRLFQCIAIRRQRHSINLPDRIDLRRYIYLNEQERTSYRQIESPIVDMLDSALRKDLQEPAMYMHALLKINSLRQFCNVGLESKVSTMGYKSPSPAGIANGSDLVAIVNDLLSSGKTACAKCNSDVRFTLEEDGSPSEETPSAYISECMQLMCIICYRQSDTPGIAPLDVCKDHIPCRLSSTVVAPISRSTYGSLASPMGRVISPKVTSLRMELQKLSDEKRYT
jgi:SWI/SNF-related matrix-associated actin-dependent regulator of chromatin subfamily A3